MKNKYNVQSIKNAWYNLPEYAQQCIAACVIVVLGAFLVFGIQAILPQTDTPMVVNIPTEQPTMPNNATITPQDAIAAAIIPVGNDETFTVVHSPYTTDGFTVTATLETLTNNAIGYVSDKPNCLLIEFAGPPKGDGWVCDERFTSVDRVGMTNYSRPIVNTQPQAQPNIPYIPYTTQAPIEPSDLAPIDNKPNKPSAPIEQKPSVTGWPTTLEPVDNVPPGINDFIGQPGMEG